MQVEHTSASSLARMWSIRLLDMGATTTSKSDATLNLFDTMTCITDTNHHRIRMTSYWQINGSLTSTFTGHYSATTPPATLDYVNAAARSELQISGYGVGAAPYGGNSVGRFLPQH